MSNYIQEMKAKAAAQKKTIVLPEGEDQRTIDALMLVRHAEQVERRSKRRTKIQGDKHPAFSAEDRRRFVRNLEGLLADMLHR